MYKPLLGCLIAVIAIFSSACSPKHSEIVVAEYGDYEIKMKEFEDAYVKNVGSLEKAKEDSLDKLQKFLDLYVNFKMKLRDAYVRNLQNDPKIISELNNYERTIGTSYLLEKELVNKGIRSLYDKRGEELRVSHILIRTDSLSDEQAKAKALEIIESINNGSSFEEEVKLHSEDQFSKKKGGDIYYITAGMIMPQFEEAAYATEIGQVNPNPLKTRYGYHIIKVTDRRKRTPRIRASHILIPKESKDTASNAKVGLELANEVLAKARDGEDFGELAKEYSIDPGSKDRGGDLGFFERRRMVQPFDEAAFSLETGEISGIVETQFGFHIIKITDKMEYNSFDEEEKKVRELYEKTRRKYEYEELIKKYSDEVDFNLNQANFDNLVANIGDEKFDETYWESDLRKNLGDNELFNIGGKQFIVDSLFSFAINSEEKIGKDLTEQSVNDVFGEFKNQRILEAKASKLLSNDSTFINLMTEYKNGILIFRLQEEEVWNKMKMDSTEIKKLYESTKNKYKLVDRVKYSELYSEDENQIKEFFTLLNNGADFDSLVVEHNEKSHITNLAKKKPVHATFSVLSKEAFKLENKGDYTDIIENDGKWSILRLEEKLPARIKTFEEAKAEVTSEYQDIESKELEAEYISKLKERYEPKLFYEELKNAYTE